MGSRCLTDGEWVWPEGLAHYVEAHHVRLPDEFLGWMRTCDWHVAEAATTLDQGKPNTAFWIDWGRAHARGSE
ncbi:MAG: hypothetical protein ACI8QZ_000078 [Chlamydiales bacterium]|jgi:hypothetical protein